MTLAELYRQPIQDAVKALTLVNLQVHTDDAGTVRVVELKFASGEELKGGSVKR